VVSLAFNPDGTWLATGTREGDIDFWDTSLQNWDSPIFTLSNDSEVLDIVFSPDKQWLATGGNDGRVDFWNLETLSKENILTINGEKVTSLAFSPDGKWLAIGSDDDMGATSSKATIRILNLANQQIIHTLSDLGTNIEDVAFSPDGQWFAASTGFYHDWNGSVSLWKSSEIEESPQVLTGKSLAFSPDGQWLALEGGGTIYEREPTRLWNLSSDNNLVSDFISMTENSSFGHVIFSPDGNWLITGHFEEIRLWPLQMDTLVDLACRTVGRNLTFLEWETYFPQENYRKTCFN
jgi:WD40 repeat protein